MALALALLMLLSVRELEVTSSEATATGASWRDHNPTISHRAALCEHQHGRVMM